LGHKVPYVFQAINQGLQLLVAAKHFYNEERSIETLGDRQNILQ
jgi:hypothetical protein